MYAGNFGYPNDRQSVCGRQRAFSSRVRRPRQDRFDATKVDVNFGAATAPSAKGVSWQRFSDYQIVSLVVGAAPDR
jgi:hypothetical protein